MRKELITEKARMFPQAFKILPIVDGKPKEIGSWAAYPNDESTIFWIDTSHNEALKFYSEQLRNEEESRMSKELTVNEERTIKSMIAANMKAIKSILPQHITPERFARIAYTAIVSNPTLARCTQISLINTIIEASTLGLEIGGAMREASLIPFKNNKTNTYEATLVAEYPGLIKLAKNTGEIKNISAHPVYENDQFRYNYGINQDLVHIPAEGVKGKLTNAYCIIWYINGGVDFEVVGPHEAEAAKNKSAAKFRKDSPWNQEENIPAMWVKTAIRRIMKRVPKAAEQRFIQIDGLSGSEMDHVKDSSEIVNLTSDDFYSIYPNAENDEQPKQKGSKKKQEPKQQAPQEPKQDQKELSKAVQQVLFLAKKYPSEFGKSCSELKIDPGKIETISDEIADQIYDKINDLVDAQN